MENGNRPKQKQEKGRKKERKKAVVDQTPIVNITSIFRNMRNSNGKEGGDGRNVYPENAAQVDRRTDRQTDIPAVRMVLELLVRGECRNV